MRSLTILRQRQSKFLQGIRRAPAQAGSGQDLRGIKMLSLHASVRGAGLAKKSNKNDNKRAKQFKFSNTPTTK